MKKRTAKTFSMLLASLMVFSLFGCGASKETTAEMETVSEENQAEAEDGAITNKAEAGEKPEGWKEADATETIVYQSPTAINTLDKWSQSAGDITFSVDYMIFDGLLNKDDEGNMIPWIATDWEMSEDASQITFNLRDDVYFTNGELLTADDVIFSFERLRDDTEHLPDSSVKGWRNYLGELEKINDFSFTLHFSQPMPEFWSLVDTPDVQIINKKAFEETDYDTFWANPVGTGPYVVSSFDGANSIVDFELRTDEHGYWAYKANNTYTNVKHVTFQYSPEDTTRVSSLRTGEADVIANAPTSDAQALTSEGYTVQQVPASTYTFLQLACGEDNVFANKDLREAFSLCIDRAAIVDALLDGYGIPCNYPAKEKDLGYRDDISYEYDVEKAKELVASSGYNGETIKFIYTTSTVPIAAELVPAIQAMAIDIGLNVDVVPLEVAVYDDARSTRDFDVCLASIGNSGNMWFKTAAEVIGNDRFNTGLTNTEMMDLGKQMQVTVDIDKQDEILAELYKMELTEFEPNLYLYWPINISVWNNDIAGISYHGHKIIDLSTMVVVQ